MKKLIAFPLIYITYCIGDICSKIAYKFDTWKFIFSMYQKFMDWSVQLEDWNNTQYVWKKVKDGKLFKEGRKIS